MARGARKASKVVAINVTRATTGPAATGAPSGISRIRSNAIGRTDTAISMRTVPDTTGVKTRRRNGSHIDSMT